MGASLRMGIHDGTNGFDAMGLGWDFAWIDTFGRS